MPGPVQGRSCSSSHLSNCFLWLLPIPGARPALPCPVQAVLGCSPGKWNHLGTVGVSLGSCPGAHPREMESSAPKEKENRAGALQEVSDTLRMILFWGSSAGHQGLGAVRSSLFVFPSLFCNIALICSNISAGIFFSLPFPIGI